jgi:hypothetical protein
VHIKIYFPAGIKGDPPTGYFCGEAEVLGGRYSSVVILLASTSL